jgi:hypothetical protein
MADYVFHFSEDPTIEVFTPRVAPTQQVEGAYVWAVDEHRAPTYWFPRQCPRGTWWNADGGGHRVHAIEWDWVDRFLTAEIYAYRFAAAPFRTTLDEFGGAGRGFWVTTETVTPVDVEPVGPLLGRHRAAGIELRCVTDLWSLWLEVIELPDIDFSGIRLANLPQHPDHATRGHR